MTTPTDDPFGALLADLGAETAATTIDRLAMMRAVVFPNLVLTNSSRTLLYMTEHITAAQNWGATDGNPAEGYGIQTVDSISSIVWNTLR